jgi:hypothetical protein
MTDTRDAERRRLDDDTRAWKRWGPYVSERAWGTVREDYSANGDAWGSFPHDHARSRAFRWSEDGLGALCDDEQRLCLAFAFWNERDPIMKERIFGLDGHEGNHGEDAKEYWWYLDSTPTHSWMRWRYAYPQAEFPYQQLLDENRRRGRFDAEYELLDTGIFDQDRYFEITVDYAKADVDDICLRVSIRNAGPDAAPLHVLPTLYFRNTWSWGQSPSARPLIVADDAKLLAEHGELGRMVLVGSDTPQTIFCDNESNAQRLWGVDASPAYPKDGLGDHVVHGAATVNPSARGTKAALWYQLLIPAASTVEIALRFSSTGGGVDDGTWHRVLDERSREADDFFGDLTPASASAEEAMVLRQAIAGLLWSKQFYHYDVERWLDGDPAGPVPSQARRSGRNSTWRHLNNHDIISMPDKWEYPWYGAWDLAFHCVALARADPTFAKEQLVLLCREWYMHPNGQLPAYEWSLGDVNPPVHAWAALRVFAIDGSTDHQFLARIFQKLLLNFTWWVNRKDQEGNNVFEGGFLGLDNIGPIDRSAALPVAGRLEQSDSTAWMALYCLDMLQIAIVLAEQDVAYEDMATKFFEHFAYIADALQGSGLWDDEDGFYYDVLLLDGGARIPLKVQSLVGVLPIAAATTLTDTTLERLPWFAEHSRWFLENRPHFAMDATSVRAIDGIESRLLAIASPERLRRILVHVLDQDGMLSPHGVRSVSARHREHPFALDLAGMRSIVDYEPAESTSGLFGGNSNWRGPVWFPVNYVVIEALGRYARFFGDEFRIECPTGSGQLLSLDEVAHELGRRLLSLFLDDDHGRRAAFADSAKFQSDKRWHDQLLFYEYFDGDTGKGLGASHQTGWTGLVADLIIRRHTNSMT